MGGARLTQLTWQLLPFMWLDVDEGIKPTLYAAVSPDARGAAYYGPRGFYETVRGGVTFAGTKAAVGLVVLHRLPTFVDKPVRFVVLIDEHLGTNVPVERPGILERSAHKIARRGHRLGLHPEFKYHRDRHRRLLTVCSSSADLFVVQPL